MKLILEILSYAGDGLVSYRSVESFPLTIGRGYHNDVILNDPHVGGAHLRIEHDAEGWVVHNVSSDAAITVNTVERRGDRHLLRSGDALRIGQTEIRLFTPHHPVADPVPMAKDSPVIHALTRPRNAYILLAAALAAISGWTWLEAFEEDTARTVVFAGAAAFAVTLVWAGIWAAAGRLLRHKSYFMGHLALASLYILFSTVFEIIQSGIDFLSNENAFALAGSYALNMVLISLLIYGSLSLATLMPKRRRTLWSLCFSGGLLAGVFLMSLIDAQEFNDTADYPATLRPYLAQIAPHQDLKGFMAGNERLFESDALSELPDENEDEYRK